MGIGLSKVGQGGPKKKKAGEEVKVNDGEKAFSSNDKRIESKREESHTGSVEMKKRPAEMM